MISGKNLLLPLVVAMVLAGCAGVEIAELHAVPATPAAYKNQPSSVSENPVIQKKTDWWKSFADEQLDALIERALAHNTSLQAAAARLAQAQALSRRTSAALFPQLGIAAAPGRQGGNFYRAQDEAGTLHQLRLEASYEVDVMGRQSKASEASRLVVQVAESLLADARLLVQANVAQAYFALRTLDAERALTRDTVAAYRETLRITEGRFAAGDVSELDVARLRSEVAATESEALALDRRRQELETALAVLVGDLPSNLNVAEIPWMDKLPAVPAGLPSAMLERRPDIAAARASYQAAQVRVGVAQTAWFPNISLTAATGGASPELSDLFRSSAGLWGVNVLLNLPILDGGRRDAGIQNAAAQADEAAALYRGQILAAFKDVEDQLSNLALLSQQGQRLSEAVTAAQRALSLSGTRYRNGMISQLELLDAQRSELGNRRRALQVRAAQYLSTVALIKALGGSWL